MGMTRRSALLVAGSSVLATAVGCGEPEGPNNSSDKGTGDVPDKPKEPVTLNVLDVAGNLQLTQGMIDEFASKNSDVLAKVTYSKATAPELVGKIKAQQG